MEMKLRILKDVVFGGVQLYASQVLRIGKSQGEALLQIGAAELYQPTDKDATKAQNPTRRRNKPAKPTDSEKVSED